MGSLGDQHSQPLEVSGQERALVYADMVSATEDVFAWLQQELHVVTQEITRRSDQLAKGLLRPGSATSAPPRVEQRLLNHLQPLPSGASMPGRSVRPRRRPNWRAIFALAVKADFNADRLGAVWWVAEPLLHVILITLATFFLHGGDVFDMPAFPFVVLGAVIWLTFRSSFMAVISGTGSLTQILEHPAASRFDVVLARSVRGLVINSLVATALMTVSLWQGWVTPPENILLVAASFASAAGLGIGVGFAANHAAQFYPGLRKIYVMILRVVAMFSGLFYVSEQLPAPYDYWVLWNPMTHISQLARSGWFDTYESTDTSVPFLMACLLGSLALGLGCAIMNRRTRARLGEIA